MPNRELLLERLERLAIVLDELMPECAELVRDALALLKEQKDEIAFLKKMQLQTVQNMREEDIGEAVARILNFGGQ